ncbi:unnamed protein product [Gongylonema pulchrum]|uniref:Importin N-terminal domain-containing protein n=1 Tax=Gongylonema pulchrum TaxID=637853 RepID=A0A183CV92_9BILA|nr:unnamed protein product [Gongylonema pulchrum]
MQEPIHEVDSYLLVYLDERAASLPPFVLTSLCQLFARITKLGWNDYDSDNNAFPFREPLFSILKYAEKNSDKGPLAVQLLAQLVSDINSSAGFDSLIKQRKTATIFRDEHLFDIFKLSTSVLQKTVSGGTSPRQLSTVNGLLQLSLNCLSFDFVGSVCDETSEDNATVQVPTSWRIGRVLPLSVENKECCIIGMVACQLTFSIRFLEKASASSLLVSALRLHP